MCLYAHAAAQSRNHCAVKETVPWGSIIHVFHHLILIENIGLLGSVRWCEVV